jgi:dihydroorotate dehydrogenase electron transfer subunit
MPRNGKNLQEAGMKDVQFCVEYNKPLCGGVFELKIRAEEKLPPVGCGKFLHIETGNPSLLLRRPFCICKSDAYSVTVVVAKVGAGTASMSELKKGDKVRAALPLGNGFTLTEAHKKVALIGGGVGCAPLLSVPSCYPDKSYRAYLGFPDAGRVILESDFAAVCKTSVATDDGSYGRKGFVTDLFADGLEEFAPDVILTCGPVGMLKAVAKIAAARNVEAYMSGEARMGCGVGACLVCACGVRGGDGLVHSMRACADGPVFNLKDVVL